MRSKSERVLLAITVLGILAIAAGVTLHTVAVQKGEEALAKLAESVPAEARPFLESPVSAAPRDQPAQSAQPAPSNSVIRFAALFKRAEGVGTLDTWQRTFGDRPPKDWTDEEWKRVEDATDAIQELVRDIRDAAEQGGPAIRLDLSEGIYTELPHLAPLRQLARLLTMDAWVQARRERHEAGVLDVLATMKLANCLLDEPLLISQLVRLAITSMAYDTARATFPPGSLSPDLAGNLIAYAAQDYHREAFTRGLAGEGMMPLDCLNRIRNGQSVNSLIHRKVPELDTRSLEGMLASVFRDPEAVTLKAYGSPLGAPWRALDVAAFAGVLSAVVDASRLPYYQALPRIDQIEQTLKALPKTRILTFDLLGGLPRAAGAQARGEAMLDLMRIGLTLDQYRVRNGSYPRALDVLEPDLGAKIPVDPFTGGPYHYEVVNDHYTLYSVSMNLMDDQGKDNAKDGDIVWRVQR